MSPYVPLRAGAGSLNNDDPIDKDIYLINPDGTNLTRLTTSQNGRDSMSPNW